MRKALPEWLSSALSPEDVESVSIAVREAEKKTSAEIVPMIVHRSTLKATGDRILFWICFGLLGMSGAIGLSILGDIDELILDRVVHAIGLWPTASVHMMLSILAEVVVALMAFGISWLVSSWLAKYDAVQRLVFPSDDLTLEAEHRAQTEFYSSDLRSTSGRTGVLLFVSMLERRAVILADEAIAKRFDPSTWGEILKQLLEEIRAGHMGRGYVRAIQSIGAKLEKEFPVPQGDRDELANGLRIEE